MRYQTVEKNGPARHYWLGNLSARANKSGVFLYPSPDTVTVVGNSPWPSSSTTFDCSTFLYFFRENRICGLVTLLVLSVIDNVDRIKMLFRKGGSVCATQAIIWWKKNSRAESLPGTGFQRFVALLTGCIIFHIISLDSPTQICG